MRLVRSRWRVVWAVPLVPVARCLRVAWRGYSCASSGAARLSGVQSFLEQAVTYPAEAFDEDAMAFGAERAVQIPVQAIEALAG